MENGSEVRAVEIRYAGVLVGRSTKVRDWDTAGAFIGFAEPLPSGTSLVLKGDGVEQAARVVEVFESADPTVAGMQVKFMGAAQTAHPPQKPAAEARAATVPAPEPARAPAPAAATVEASPGETSQGPTSTPDSTPTSTPTSTSTSTVTTEPGDGEPEQGEHAGSGGKRRRRRR